MHELIDAGIVETIRTTGKTNANLPDRLEILKTHGLPYDREAENVVVTGCQILPLLPHIIASLARVLDRGGVSYTFLSEETCCGNYLYRPAIKARNDEAMEECRSLSREFVGQNVERARRLGAKRLVIFCSPCYPIYKHAFPDEEIVFYPRAIREAMGRARLESRVDYYAGCYRLHRKFSPVPMDLKSA
ncbi:MAG: (Fe-S)-binding protein, partial [Deltaproteobacteria bacterium]|nr:(Fe-S)-binding protein [Deltaproteobacteria bacterium]